MCKLLYNRSIEERKQMQKNIGKRLGILFGRRPENVFDYMKAVRNRERRISGGLQEEMGGGRR